jgi:DNA-directed RNA polymerase specialized sigma subunit
MGNIKSLPKVDKYSDFTRYYKHNPHLTRAELAAAYHVTTSTISQWKSKFVLELKREKV